jgi:hypothetical protein
MNSLSPDKLMVVDDNELPAIDLLPPTVETPHPSGIRREENDE